MATHSRHYVHARRDVRNRVAAVLFFAVTLLTSSGWTGHAWGKEKLPRIGILSFFAVTEEPAWKQSVEQLRRHLANEGWIDGKNVLFEIRSAHGESRNFTEAAAELVGLKVDVIFAPSAPSVRAAYAATHSIPIVAIDYTNDPIFEGYIDNYARPGHNITGVFLDAPEFAGKWFELLKAMIPDLSRVAAIWDPGPGATHLQAVRDVANSLGIKLQVVEASKPEELDRAFSALRGRPQAVIILPSPMNYFQSAQLARLALKHRLPATSMATAFAATGGPITYGPDDAATDQRSAALIAKILGGAKPADVPAERPTKIQLIVNLKTAKALGLTIPQSILLRADEVIRE